MSANEEKLRRDDLERKRLENAIRRTIKSLPERHRQAIEMQSDGVPQSEIIARMGITRHKLHVMLSRARQKLVEILRDQETAPITVAHRATSRQELLLEVEIPADADGHEVEEVIAAVVREANALHKAHGGSGLKIEDLQIWQDALVTAGAE